MALVQSVDDVINLIWRRKGVVVLTALVSALLLSPIVLQQEQLYRASASIQVEGPQVEDFSAGRNAGSNSAQILQTIEQRLTNRENLLAVIERQEIAAADPESSTDSLVKSLRDSIRFETVAGAPGGFGNSASISAIIVSVTNSDAELSARIANDLAQSILDMSNQGVSSRARDTYDFFAGEEKRIRTEIVKLESDLSTYQNANTDSLPVLAEARRAELQGLDSELRAIDQQMLEITSEKSRLEGQGVQRETDRRRMDELLSALALLNDKQAFTQKRRADLAGRLAIMPEVEQTIAAQKRILMLLQDRYSSVTQSLAEAETNLFLAERQQSERFMLLDRAITPEGAAGINKKKLAMAAILGSLLIGILAAVLLELAFPIIRTTAQLEHAMGVSALGAIPEIRNLARRDGRGGFPALTSWGMVAVVAIAIVVLVTSSGIR
ncbi:MAG: Wzz/FepE/Etk N-terminal domain-containing protein [Pseudomonadota bacterium]